MLFGNNMSWLYGKLKKKLDAPATAGSAGDVLTLGESGKPEWAEGGGGGGILVVKGSGEITIEDTPDNMTVYIIAADHIADDIVDAYKNFVPVYFYIPDLKLSSEHMYDNGAVHVFLLNNRLYEDDFVIEAPTSCGYYLDDGVFYLYYSVQKEG